MEQGCFENSKLKECPFCGGEADFEVTEYPNEPTLYVVFCTRCRAKGSYGFSVTSSIINWNMRYDIYKQTSMEKVNVLDKKS